MKRQPCENKKLGWDQFQNSIQFGLEIVMNKYGILFVFLSILAQFLGNFDVSSVHFGIMLGHWSQFWGPLTPLGAILGSTSKFEPIFEQIRENGADHFGVNFCGVRFSHEFWEGFWRGQCGPSVVNSSQNRCFHFPKIVTFWTLFGTILAHLGLQKGSAENVSKIDPPKSCRTHARIMQ